MNVKIMFLQLAILICIFETVYCSTGDSSQYFQKCTEKCQILNCTKDGSGFVSTVKERPIHLKLMLWDCKSDCQYDCMWKTTDAYIERKWNVPQFYGKWPFVRILGIQEPASFIFSLLNLYYYSKGFIAFRRSVRNDSPFFWIWQGLSAVAINAWIWSSIFHARDFAFTEFMDYICAFSTILMHCYCMVQRLLFGMPRTLNILITTFFLAFFVNHSIYLFYGKVDYGYNMMLHLTMGGVTIFLWFVWSFLNRAKQPYLWKCVAFFSLTAFTTSLEVFDFPPIWWTIDSHSLWHLSSAVICPIFYGFVIDDCKYLRKIAEYKSKNV